MTTSNLLLGESLRHYYNLYGVEDLTDEDVRHLFPDELMEYVFCPYQGKLKDILGYDLYKDSFEEMRICLLKNMNGKLIKVSCIISEDEKIIFIDNRTFNQHWKQIASGLKRGFNRLSNAENGYMLKDINQRVDLRWMETPTREAKINDDFVIELKGREIDIETQRLISKRTAAMDDPRMKYVYSKNDHLYHDKTCKFAEKIPYWEFEASETIPPEREQCAHCHKASVIRAAIGDEGKKFAWYYRFFDRGKLKLHSLENFLQLENIKIQMDTPNEMIVTYKQDTWKIVLNEDLRYMLYHNNYYIKDRKRYIKDDFHLQFKEPTSLNGIVHYIEIYDWTTHLVVEEPKIVLEIAKSRTSIKERLVAFWNRIKTQFREHAESINKKAPCQG